MVLSSHSAKYLQYKHMDICIANNHIDTLRMSIRKTILSDEIWDTVKSFVDEHKIQQRLENAIEVAETMKHAGNTMVWDQNKGEIVRICNFTALQGLLDCLHYPRHHRRRCFRYPFENWGGGKS